VADGRRNGSDLFERLLSSPANDGRSVPVRRQPLDVTAYVVPTE
jgi:hypothetical protein